MRTDRLPPVAGLLLLPLLSFATPAQALPRPRVALVKSSAIGPFETAARALSERLGQDPLQPELLTFDLDGESANGPPVLREVRQAHPDLIITVGSLATSVTLAESWPVPIVFSMVLYPRASGFLSDPARPVTGVSLDVPLEIQFDTLRRLVPQARRIGVLYHPNETGLVVEEAGPVATARGFTLVAKRVDGPTETPAALKALMEEVDVIWAVADSHVFTPRTTPTLILEALRRRIPLFGLSNAHVRSGAIAALSADYAAVGRDTADLAVRVMRGDDAAKIPVLTLRAPVLSLNLRTAGHLGMDVAADLQAEATEIVR